MLSLRFIKRLFSSSYYMSEFVNFICVGLANRNTVLIFNNNDLNVDDFEDNDNLTKTSK